MWRVGLEAAARLVAAPAARRDLPRGPAAAAAFRMQLRPARAFSSEGIDMNQVLQTAAKAAGVSVATAAARKLLSFVDYKSNFPKEVRLVFQEEKSEVKRVVLWFPEEQYLHEAFFNISKSIQDFELSYVDQDCEMQLQPSKSQVDRFLRSGRAELKVLWRPPSAMEQVKERVGATLSAARNLFTGDGSATETALKTSEAHLEKQGVKMVPCDQRRSFVEGKHISLEKWKDLCPKVVKMLGVEGTATETQLELADEMDVKMFDIVESTHGNRITSSVVACYTARNMGLNKITVIFGRHEVAMEAATDTASFPPGNCIQFKGRNFTVLPPTSPHLNGIGTDVEDQWFNLPSGWQVVDASAADVADIAANVIRPYYWHALFLVLRDSKEKGFKAWWTSRSPEHAGKLMESFKGVESDGSQRFRLINGGCRLLIEQKPQTSPELINHWKRYVELSAQVEFTKRLGPMRPEELLN